MRLNPDCVRDVLLYLEENLSYISEDTNSLEHNSIGIHKIAEDLHNQNGYKTEDVHYSIEKLIEIRYIIPKTELRGNHNTLLYCPIADISYAGHMFLGTIRGRTIWEATKSTAKKLGGISIQGLSLISSSIIQSLASNPEFIQNIINMIQH